MSKTFADCISASPFKLAHHFIRGMLLPAARYDAELRRMDFSRALTVKEFIMRALVKSALSLTVRHSQGGLP